MLVTLYYYAGPGCLKTIQWIKTRNCYVIKDKKDTSPRFRSVRVPKLQIFVKIFAQINRAQYGARRPENSVNIWILLWTSRREII